MTLLKTGDNRDSNSLRLTHWILRAPSASPSLLLLQLTTTGLYKLATQQTTVYSPTPTVLTAPSLATPLDRQSNAANPTLLQLLLLPLANTTINTDIKSINLSTAAQTEHHKQSLNWQVNPSAVPDSAVQLINWPGQSGTAGHCIIINIIQPITSPVLLLTEPHIAAQIANLHHLNGQAWLSCNRNDSITPTTTLSLACSATTAPSHFYHLIDAHSPSFH